MNRTSRRKRPTAIDLFSGCGGLTLGLKRAGFRVIAAVENETFAAKTYKTNHRSVRLWKRDIRKLPAREIAEQFGLRAGDLDLLAGCPPCQGFSSMRSLNGKRRVRDKRNDLMFEFLRFVRVLRPKAVMLENVPGLASSYRLKRFKSVLRRLGYIVNADIKNAKHFGVPQRRRRLILLAGQERKIDFAPESLVLRTVKQTIGNLAKAGCSRDQLHDLAENRSKRIQSLIKAIPVDGGSRTDLPACKQLPCHQRCNGFKDVYGRMAWDQVAPTITSGCFNPSKGRFLHPKENRTITLREAAMLQGFPQDYCFPSSPSKQAVALLIGNALPPEFVRRHAQRVVEFLSTKPS
jgi:DNA (cytosine-5)-methyltransferase 1